MKKMILATAISTLYANVALASSINIYTEHAKHSNVQGIEVKHQLDMGSQFSIEVKTDKSVDLGVKHDFYLTENLYLAPSFNYVFNRPSNEYFERVGTFTIEELAPGGKTERDIDGIQRFETLGFGTDVAQLGLTLGYRADNGLYASGRYRLDYATEKTGAKVSIFEGMEGGPSPLVDSAELSTRSRIARTDLVIGYAAEQFDIKYTAIHQSERNSDLRNLYQMFGEKYDGWSSEAELTWTGLESIHPYMQYVGQKTFGGLDDDALRIGIKARF